MQDCVSHYVQYMLVYILAVVIKIEALLVAVCQPVCQGTLQTVERLRFTFAAYGKRQTANVSWEFLKIENKHIKAVEDDS